MPLPRSFEPADMVAHARKRIDWAQGFVDLRDTTVLEIGCGRGYDVYVIAHDYGSVVHGIDVVEYASWAQFGGDNVTFIFGDMAADNPFEHNTFDRIISYTVWEHVVHPSRLLQETYNVLKPGGQALIRANLYAGPQASHRYREIFFPWPHLLFSDDVISRLGRQERARSERASWVNRLSWGHYERYIAEIGFNLRHLSFSGARPATRSSTSGSRTCWVASPIDGPQARLLQRGPGEAAPDASARRPARPGCAGCRTRCPRDR